MTAHKQFQTCENLFSLVSSTRRKQNLVSWHVQQLAKVLQES